MASRGRRVFLYDGEVSQLVYNIDCDVRWNTQSARVSGSVGNTRIEVVVERDDREWRLNEVARPEVDGCVDIDLNFSPMTNLLPIRRRPLEIGQSMEVRGSLVALPDVRARAARADVRPRRGLGL